MARTVMVFNKPTLKLATSEAGLAAGTAYECQVTSAVIGVTVNFNTVPATGCAGASQSPGTPAYQLDLAWLQDWSTAGGGLSGFLQQHIGEAIWAELTPDKDDAATKATINVWAVPGGFGGTFGDGSPGATTATMPALDEPTYATPAPAGALLEDLEPV